MTSATQQFRIYRIHSVTRPYVGAGLLQGFGFGRFSRQELAELTAECLGFYIEDLVQDRDDECRTEQFMLQGANSLNGPWEDIKLIVPAAGEDPYNSVDEEDDDRWGQCLRCKRNLNESEYALNDVCEDCRPEYFEEWQDEQDRLAEDAAEARWIM